MASLYTHRVALTREGPSSLHSAEKPLCGGRGGGGGGGGGRGGEEQQGIGGTLVSNGCTFGEGGYLVWFHKHFYRSCSLG